MISPTFFKTYVINIPERKNFGVELMRSILVFLVILDKKKLFVLVAIIGLSYDFKKKVHTLYDYLLIYLKIFITLRCFCPTAFLKSRLIKLFHSLVVLLFCCNSSFSDFCGVFFSISQS